MEGRNADAACEAGLSVLLRPARGSWHLAWLLKIQCARPNVQARVALLALEREMGRFKVQNLEEKFRTQSSEVQIR